MTRRLFVPIALLLLTGPALADCTDEVCVTCSDVAVPVTIVDVLPDAMARVSTSAGEEEISIALVSAGPGDTVLVHAGEAIAVVPR